MNLTGLVLILLVALFSVLAFWKPNAILFMMLSVASITVSFFIPDLISPDSSTTGIDIAVFIGLIIYSFLCVSWAFKLMFWKEEPKE
jgi:hypothetical protein